MVGTPGPCVGVLAKTHVGRATGLIKANSGIELNVIGVSNLEVRSLWALNLSLWPDP
jgi:hypothetical protein